MRLLPLIAVVAAFAVVSPASAATVRYASPDGSGSDCSDATPCSLQTAVESAASGDTVTIAPGSYAEGSDPLVVPAGVTVMGSGTGAYPQIESDAPTAVSVGAGVTLARVAVHGTGGRACEIASATVRDAICWSTGDSSRAAYMTATGATTVNATLRNVTLV